MTKGDIITIHTKDKIFLGQYELPTEGNKEICIFCFKNNEYVYIPYKNIINIYKSVLDVKSMINIFQNTDEV